jgi:cellobionic acid phosphorylase
LIDGLFGVRGDVDGLHIKPQLPKDWNQVEVVRKFRGCTFDITMQRTDRVNSLEVHQKGTVLKEPVLKDFDTKRQEVKVLIPMV